MLYGAWFWPYLELDRQSRLFCLHHIPQIHRFKNQNNNNSPMPFDILALPVIVFFIWGFMNGLKNGKN